MTPKRGCLEIIAAGCITALCLIGIVVITIGGVRLFELIQKAVR